MANAETISPAPFAHETKTLLRGISVGVLAASIGAVYVVFARWGIQHGAAVPDLTALRFGVSGLILLPYLAWRMRRNGVEFASNWRIWLAISLLAGTPLELLMFSALQFAPASHAAVFPFAAMSVMGMIMSALAFGDRMGLRRIGGIAVVLAGLILISGVSIASFTMRGLGGDVMFLAAGTIWAGFGILLRKHSLDPMLATAVIAVSAMLTYLPAYLWLTGGAGLVALDFKVLVIEAVIQGALAGTGTL